MNQMEQKAYIFGTIFTLSNKLQILGDDFDHNITVKERLFIICVSRFGQPPTISEVANFMGYSRQNAKRIAAALHKRDFVTITKDENDQRASRIALTEKCNAYFAQRDKGEVEFLETLFAGFDAEMIRGVCRGFAALEQNIKKMMTRDTAAGE